MSVLSEKETALHSEGERLFNTTRRKIVLVVTLTSMLVMLAFSIFVVLTYKAVVFQNVDDILNAKMNSQYASIQKFSQSDVFFRYDELESEIFGDSEENTGRELAVFLFARDELVKSNENTLFKSGEYPELKNFSEGTIKPFSIGMRHYRGTMVSNDEIKVVTVVSVGAEWLTVSKVVAAVAAGYLLVLIIVIFISYYFSKLIIKPIKRAYLQEVCFVQDASHEMRTPLAVIRGKAQLLAQNPNDTIEMHSDEIADIVSEISSMEKMNRNLLLLSKQDVYSPVDITEFRMIDLFSSLSDDLYSLLAESQEKRFSFSVEPDDLTVKWDMAQTKQALTILLDNAFKYTDEGDEIFLGAKEENSLVEITVYDSGRGIKNEDLPRIFDRFYRTDEARASETQGSGIGLSMLKSIGDNLGFSIKVTSSYGNYTQFVITTPCVMKKQRIGNR